MKIKLLFFAQLRDVFHGQEREYEIQDGMCVKEVADMLLDARLKALPMLYALNETLVNGNTLLHDKDVLALIPPVAGG
ncbi:MAG: MoaD/ThiS family protein [Chlamydiota bacterium]|nr:MoaD/ThiS family protein [Chlamydiota bacterium]